MICSDIYKAFLPIFVSIFYIISIWLNFGRQTPGFLAQILKMKRTIETWSNGSIAKVT